MSTSIMFPVEDIRKANEKLMSGHYSIPKHNRVQLTEKQVNAAWAIVKSQGKKH